MVATLGLTISDPTSSLALDDESRAASTMESVTSDDCG